MDKHAVEIWEDSINIGELHWHPERPPRIVLNETGGVYQISLSHAQRILEKYKKIRENTK